MAYWLRLPLLSGRERALRYMALDARGRGYKFPESWLMTKPVGSLG